MAQIKARNNALDGLRWFAVTLVVASHCTVLSQGGLANCIFFVLTGFFAVSPASDDGEERFLHPKELLRYYVSRILRIFPVYWAYLLCTWYFFSPKWIALNIHDFTSFTSVLLNMLCIKCTGHLWFLQQIVFFYAIAPILFLLVCGVKRLLRRFIKNAAAVDVLLAVCFLILAFVSKEYHLIYLQGNNTELGFFFYEIGFGIAAGYLYRAYRKSGLNLGETRSYRVFGNLCIIAFILFCIFSAEPILSTFSEKYDGFLIGWQKPMLCSALSAIVVFVIYSNQDIFMNKILGCKLLSYLGRISFNIYLVHYTFLQIFYRSNHVRQFASVYVISVACAVLLHAFVEKPSIIFSKNYKMRDVADYFKSLFSIL